MTTELGLLVGPSRPIISALALLALRFLAFASQLLPRASNPRRHLARPHGTRVYAGSPEGCREPALKCIVARSAT